MSIPFKNQLESSSNYPMKTIMEERAMLLHLNHKDFGIIGLTGQAIRYGL